MSKINKNDVTSAIQAIQASEIKKRESEIQSLIAEKYAEMSQESVAKKSPIKNRTNHLKSIARCLRDDSFISLIAMLNVDLTKCATFKDLYDHKRFIKFANAIIKKSESEITESAAKKVLSHICKKETFTIESVCVATSYTDRQVQMTLKVLCDLRVLECSSQERSNSYVWSSSKTSISFKELCKRIEAYTTLC